MLKNLNKLPFNRLYHYKCPLIGDVKRLLFFFKFVKFPRSFHSRNKTWAGRLLFTQHKLKIKSRILFKLFFRKKKRYKRYNFFKFSILKHRRSFLPQYWYKLNCYLLTKYNYMYFTANQLTQTQTYFKILKIFNILKKSNKANSNRLTRFNSYWTGSWGNYYKLKTPIRRRFKRRKFLRIKLTNGDWKINLSNRRVRGKLRWRRFRRKFQSKFFSRGLNLRKLYLNNRPYYKRISVRKRRCQLQYIRKQFFRSPKSSLNLNCAQSQNWLTGYSYKYESYNPSYRLHLVTLKIVFNTYNFKTYNWRIIN